MTKAIKTLLALGLIASAATASAQQPPPQFPNMSFFVTSAASPKGGDLGGLAGADKICQDLAAKAGLNLRVSRLAHELGVPVRAAGPWDWRSSRLDAGPNLMPRRSTRALSGELVARLKPAAWIAGGALAIHAAAVVADWSLLRHEQSTLQRQMETRFRAAVPDAVAVVDPALQMRRKLADARHGAGVADSGDFLPMIERVAGAARELPPGTLRVAAYEQGRLALELTGIDEPAARRFAARLKQGAANLETDVTLARGSIVVIVRAS